MGWRGINRRVRVAISLAALAGIGLVPRVAAAATSTDVPLFPSGTVVYTWTASPALGCAAEGLCGLHGAVTVDVQSADLEVARGKPSQLDLETTATARTQGPAPDSSCVDMLDPAGFGIALPTTPSRSPLVLGMGPGPSAGRCAGPLMSDLPRMPIPARHHGRSVDLRTVRSETAGPFQVRLDSTLTLAPDPSRSGSVASSSSGSLVGGRGGGGGSRRLEEDVEIVDRLVPSSGALRANFAAVAAPFCLGLGDCGSTGTVDVRIDSPSRPLTLDASWFVRHRLGRAAALRAIRADAGTLAGQVSLPVTVTETVTTPGQPTCTDTRRAALVLSLEWPLATRFNLLDNSGDAIRTYCPGPLEDLLRGQLPGQAGGGMLATAPVRPGALLTPGVTLALARAPRFSDGAVHGRWMGGITLALTRQALRVHTTRVRG